MAVKHHKMTVTLDASSQEIWSWLKEQGHFPDDDVIIQEALHSLYRELQQRKRAASSSPSAHRFVHQEQLSPDDFE